MQRTDDRCKRNRASPGLAWVTVLGAVLGACEATSDSGDPAQPSLAEKLCTWTEHPDNPLIQPPDGEFLLGDPTVLAPAESPDGKWHLFANSLLGIHHHVSADGIAWERLKPPLFSLGAMRPFILRDGGRYLLFYEQFSGFDQSSIQRTESVDLATWSTPTTVLEPTLDWEKEAFDTIGNPYVTHRDGKYWLYYSASTVFLADAGFNEPRYVGVATSDSLDGPWQKHPQPLLGPDPNVSWRNHGAGSIKLLDDEVNGQRIALENGIYLDAEGHSRSAIAVLASDDGLKWREVCTGPVILPGVGWKKALVYAFDTTREGDTIRLYFNARDDWKGGVERIGLAELGLALP